MALGAAHDGEELLGQRRRQGQDGGAEGAVGHVERVGEVRGRVREDEAADGQGGEAAQELEDGGQVVGDLLEAERAPGLGEPEEGAVLVGVFVVPVRVAV